MAKSIAGGTDRIRLNPFTEQIGAVSFWFKTSQTTNNAHVISSWNASSRGGWGFVLANSGGASKLTFQAYGAAAQTLGLQSTSGISDGVWHHALANYNSANGAANSLYIDGVSESTGNSSSAWIPAVGFNMDIGDPQDSFWPTYNGQIAEVGLWSSQLTADDAVGLSKGMAPPHFNLDKLERYMPLLNAVVDRCLLTGISITGTTNVEHPRVLGSFG